MSKRQKLPHDTHYSYILHWILLALGKNSRYVVFFFSPSCKLDYIFLFVYADTTSTFSPASVKDRGLIFSDEKTKPKPPIDTNIPFKIFVLNVADLNFVFTAGPLSPTMRK